MLTKSDLKEIDRVVSKRIKTEIKTELKPIKSDISKMRKDIDVLISLFDRDYVDLRNRVERIEEHLDLPPLPH